MYSPSLLLWEQPQVLTYTDCVPGMKLSPTATGVETPDDGFLRKALGKTLFSALILSDGFINWTPEVQSSISATPSSQTDEEGIMG